MDHVIELEGMNGQVDYERIVLGLSNQSAKAWLPQEITKLISSSFVLTTYLCPLVLRS